MAVKMDSLKYFGKFSIVLLLIIGLTSCAANQHVSAPGAYSNSSKAALSTTSANTTEGALAGANAYPNGVLKNLSIQGVQVVVIGQSLKLIIFTDSCFEFGTSTLTNHCTNILNNVTALLKSTGSANIKVAGYTDTGFGDDFALRLTQEQADSVVAFLWAHGVPQQRLYAKGYGSADPIATNYTTRGNALNRRIEISL